jgi:SAM-dependent methyltransferase
MTLDLQRKQREQEFHSTYFRGLGTREQQSRFYSGLVQNTLLERALAQADRVAGGMVLHLGCGANLEIPSRLLKKGATRVFSVDLSQAACRAVRSGFKKKNDASWRYVAVMDAEQLGFASNSFEVVFGRAIIHHLDIERISEELFRILKPGGQAVLIEPLGINPLINRYRRQTRQARTVDEAPLEIADLGKFKDRFGEMRLEYFFLTQLIPIVLLSRIQEGLLYWLCFKAFGALDRFLYTVLPFLRKYSWCVVFSVAKPAGRNRKF